MFRYMNTQFFSKRIGRRDYFAYIFGTLFLFSFINVLIDALIPININNDISLYLSSILLPMVQIGLWVLLFVILSVKRLHDMNLSSMWFLFISGFITLVIFLTQELAGFFVLPAIMFVTVFLSLKKGTGGPNRFGEDPNALKHS